MNTSWDVVVAGGGVAGAAAAVAAARCGVRTLLVESAPYFGGTGYAGMFQHICGLYSGGPVVPTETLNPGIPRELVSLLFPIQEKRRIHKMGQVYVLPYSREALQASLTSLFAAEQRLTILSGATAGRLEMRNGEIASIEISGPEGRQTVSAAVVIDCTGSGNIAAAAGAGFELSPLAERQLAGFIMHVKGLQDPDEWLPIKVPFHLAQAVKQGLLLPVARFTTFCMGEAPDEGYIKMSIEAEGEGPERDEQTKKDALAIYAYLVSVLPAFRSSSLDGLSTRVLDREGRRITGEYVLTGEDVLSARKFSDGVVRNSWPIELWDREKGTRYRYVPPGDYYEIPFRCLTVKGIPNLLTAGRCISVTREALGSTRVMGTCLALGEQAGKAAAYRAQHGKFPVYEKK